MTEAVKRRRDATTASPALVYRCEFWLMPGPRSLEAARASTKSQPAELFGFDGPGDFHMANLGWCEAAFYPSSKTRSSKTAAKPKSCRTGPAARALFQGRRVGFMPEYIDHPVRT